MSYDLGKSLIYPSRDERGVYTFLIDELIDHKHLIKTAAEYHPEVSAYIKSAKPIPGYVQALITALGAGEMYGPNVNGDFFPAAALAPIEKKYGHKTFEYYAKVRKHHLNKDHHPSYGDVALSVWNEPMKRVELILKIDESAAPDLAQALAAGQTVDWSMGAKLPYDECSICGSRHKKVSDYCTHLRHMMNQIDPESGKQIYAINRYPRFFDISHVLLGADRTNATWIKVANKGQMAAHRNVSSINLFDATFGKQAVDKKAEIKKEVDSNINPQISEKIKQPAMEMAEELQDRSPDIPRKIIIQLSGMPAKNVLSTMMGLGIIPKPHEFQSLMLRSMGKPEIADDLERKNICFDPSDTARPPARLDISTDHLDRGVAQALLPMIGERSFARPVLMKRIIMIQGGPISKPKTSPQMVKSASVNMPILAALAAMFTTVAWKDKGYNKGKLDKFLMDNPAITAALGVGALSGMKEIQQLEKRPIGHFDVASEERPLYNTSNRLDLLRRLQQRPVTLIKTSSASDTIEGRLFHGLPTLLEVAAITRAQGGDVRELDQSLNKVAGSLGAGLMAANKETLKQTKEVMDSSSRVMGKVASTDDLSLFPSELTEIVCDLSIMDQYKNYEEIKV